MIQSGRLDLEANHFAPFVYAIAFPAVDFTDAVMQAQVRLRPDSPALLIDLPLASEGDEGTSFEVADGTTTVTLRIDRSTIEDTIANLLADGDSLGDNVELWWDLHITPDGLDEAVYLRGTFTVIPGVTQDA